MAKKGSFQTKAAQIAQRQGISVERGRKILAAGARNASPAAVRRNPNLKKVRGV